MLKSRCHLVLLLNLFLIDSLQLIHEGVIFSLFINQLRDHVLEVLRDLLLAELSTSMLSRARLSLLSFEDFGIDDVLLRKHNLK